MLPDAQLLIVRSAGHAMMYQYPQALAAAINRFIAQSHPRQLANATQLRQNQRQNQHRKPADKSRHRHASRRNIESRLQDTTARAPANHAEVAMTSEPCPVRRLQLLLREPCRTDSAREAAKRAAQELGMQISGEGHATLSARMPDAAFQQLFSSPSGTGGTLAVPHSLEPFVSSISEAPEHLSFD